MKGKLILTGLACIIFLSVYIPTAISAEKTEGLAALYLLDEGNVKTINDSSGNGNDGTIEIGTTWVEGKFGKALHFDVGDTISVPSSDSLNITDALTLAVWFKLDNKGVAWEALRKQAAYLLGVTGNPGDNAPPGLVAFLVWAGVPWQESFVTSKTELPIGKWVHVAGTYDGKELRVYIDGKLDATKKLTGKIDVSAESFCIGTCAGDPYEGAMDEIMVFNRALEENEIQRLILGYEKLISAVDSSSKLSTTWGSIRDRY